MKILYARREAGRLVVRVHLDTDRALPDPQADPASGATVPDPAWVYERTWPAQPPDGTTQVDYLAAIRRELRAACLDILAGGPPTATALEGQVL